MNQQLSSQIRIPLQGTPGPSREPERLLLVCFYDPAGISTVPETIAYIQAESRFAVTVLNLYEHSVGSGSMQMDASVRLTDFDGIVIHNTVSYDVYSLRSLDANLRTTLQAYKGLKVLMKQDENHRFREMAAFIRDTGFDLVFTCLPPEAIPLVYPGVSGVRFERMLTGYVTPTLRNQPWSVRERPVDIGYRGSIQPLTFGWLAYEKRKIGEDVQRLLRDSGLRLDISSRWEDRLGGDRWLDFLRSCKATLGAESGASIFDLDGDLAQRLRELEDRHRDVQDEREREETILAGLRDLEYRVHYNQLSPRHFEAAACGTVQLLYPGEYSGLLRAGRHYFELARDHSNLQEGVELLRDEAARGRMAAAAREEVVMDRRNWIETFVARLDECVLQELEQRAMRRRPVTQAPAGRNVLLLACHDPVIDPRLGWIEECAPDGIRVHQLGVLRNPAASPKLERTARGNLIVAHPRAPAAKAFWSAVGRMASATAGGRAAVLELLRIEQALELQQDVMLAQLGAPPRPERNADFVWYLHYILDTSHALIAAGLRCRNYQAIIATDLDALPAALVLKAVTGVPVIYDAHEYWPEQDARSLEYEKEFWRGIEARLCVHADYRQTVSTGLAAYMQGLYSVPFATVPNCEPLDRMGAQPADRAGDGECHFLFQGSFAVRRGIDLLIGCWPETDSRAILHLRGPDNEYRQEMIALAQRTGLLGRRIFFPDAVRESELVEAARDADVGLVPYVPYGAYRHCCPNKLSQYMAAGLPILANRTDFVEQTVLQADCGVVVDFQRKQALVQAVDGFCSDAEQRRAWGLSSRAYFKDTFNWNVAARPMYRWIEQAAGEDQGVFSLYADREEVAEQGVPDVAEAVMAPAEAIPAFLSPAPESEPVAAPAEPAGHRGGILRTSWRHLPPAWRSRLAPVALRLKRILDA